MRTISFAREIEKYSIFPCPYCCVPVIPSGFRSHCFLYHALNDDDKCVWCLRFVSVNHNFVECLRNFMKCLPRSFSWEPVDFGEINNLDTTYLDLKFLMNVDVLPLQHKGLELAVRCVRLFLMLNATTEWFHLLYSTNSAAADLVRSISITVLPFGCYCGTHQHVIIMHSKSTKTFKCTRKQRIETPMQLVDLLGKLCQTGIYCPSKLRSRTVHVKIPLPSSYKVICALQWNGGLMELIQLWYEHVNTRKLLQSAVSFNGLWGVQVCNLPGIPKRYMIPVSKTMEPSYTGGEYHVYLTKGQKLYFSKNPELEKLSFEDWKKYQEENGNSIFEAIGQDVWFPNIHQQDCISIVNEIENCSKKIKLNQVIEKLWNYKKPSE